MRSKNFVGIVHNPELKSLTDAVWVGSLRTVAFFFKLVLFAQTDFIYLPDRAKMIPN